jgi:hypothetical protein
MKMTPKRKPRRPSKKNAIRNALGQLGWHANGRDVVAYLANFGIEVNEGMVSTVKMESVKKPGEVKRHEKKVNSTDKRRKRPTLRKIPQRREYRR